MQSDPAIYLAIDPGEIHNGWATFKEDGNLITMGSVDGVDEFTDWLEAFDTSTLKAVITEDYRIGIVKGRNFGAAKHQGSRAKTAKTIGRIESWAYRNKVDVHLQGNNIKPVGYMRAGITVPKNKDLSHETDAYVHGVYWLEEQGVRKPQQARRDT